MEHRKIDPTQLDLDRIDQITAHGGNGKAFVIDKMNIDFSISILNKMEDIQFLFVNYVGGGFDIVYYNQTEAEIEPKLLF